jgi:glycosyltransferase involved in cell wall biosynthesis
MTDPLVIAMVAREQGITGVHTHVRQLRRYLERSGRSAELVTPHSWAAGRPWRRALLVPLFGARVVLERVCGPANVWWYRTSHEVFLRRALRERLAEGRPCTVYAQCPVSARAALAARRGPHQRVLLAVHFRTSQADEWADKGQIRRGGRAFRWIRGTEREVLTRVDGLVFVSEWARDAVASWLPEVSEVPGAVVPNFVNLPDTGKNPSAAATGHLVSVGNLEAVKNHRFLIRVLAAAKDEGHTYRLDVFGEGVERGRLLRLAAELGVSDQVVLHGYQSDVQWRLPRYGAYVHASYSESSSLAIMEAMAVGLPVVSSREGALGQLFDDPQHGRFWPIDDPAQAAAVLIDLMESPAELRRAGRAAKEKFLRDYDADVVAPRLLDYLSASTADAAGSGSEVDPAALGAGAEARVRAVG